MKISRAALWLIVFLSGMTFGAGRAFAQSVAALRSKSVDVAMGPAGVIFDTIAIALVSLVTYIENRFCNW